MVMEGVMQRTINRDATTECTVREKDSELTFAHEDVNVHRVCFDIRRIQDRR